MLAIGRILRTGARLLLLDEPTEGLAPVIIQQIGKTIGMLKQQGFTILLVEQNFRFASTVADRYYVDGDMAASSTGSPTPSSRPTWTSCTIIWGCDLKDGTRNAGVQTTKRRSTGENAMKGLIGLTALAVMLGCGSAQAQYSDGTIKIGVLNDMSGLYSDLGGQGSWSPREWRSRTSARPPRA